MRDIREVPYNELTQTEQIIRTTSGTLIKHFKGLEDAGILESHIVSKMIGCVKKLQAVAQEEHWANSATQQV